MKKYNKILLGLIIGAILIINHKILVIPKTSAINVKYHAQFYIDVVSSISFMAYSAFIFYKTEDRKINKLKIFYIILLDLFLLISNSFYKSGDLSYIYGGITNILYTILFLVLNFILLKRSLIFIEDYIKNYETKIKENKLIKLFDKHPFLFSLITILIFFSIYMIAFYPIILSPDPSYQIKQFFNVRTKYADYAILLSDKVFLTNHHPVVHTLLLGYSLKLGRFILNDNFGLFIYSLIQSVFLASTLAYTIKYLKDNKCSIKTRFIILCIYSLVPMFSLYAMSGVKDTIYTCFVIFYTLFVHKVVTNKNKDISIKELVLLFIILLGTYLFRNNGIYVIILSLPFVCIYSKKNTKKLVAVLLITLCSYITFSKVILPYFKITDGSIRETLSIPFQQTARYVKYYGKDLSKSDIKTIDKVLEYKTLGYRYDPTLADPVKNKYNKNATSTDLKKYFKVWFKCFFKHPLVYIEATLNNIYGYFSPQDTNWYIYYKYDTRITQDNLVNYHYNDLDGLRKILSSYAQGFPYLPLIGLLANIGFNTWILLGMVIYSLTKKKREFIIVLSPLLVSLLVCMASPVNTYFRYAMPYIFIMPSLLSLCIIYLKKEKK